MIQTPTKAYVEAARYKWQKGDLRFMLRPGQKPVYDHFMAQKTGVETVACLHRGAGKTHLGAILACQHALRNPGSTIHYVGPTRADILEAAMPAFYKVFDAACLSGTERPRWSTAYNRFDFPKNTRVLVYGADFGRVNYKRGRDVDFAAVDEVGHFEDPTPFIEEILMPRIMLYGGRMILMSTPPKSIAHPFALKISEAKENGSLFKYSIYDNPSVTKEQIADIIRRCKGETSTTFRREYLAEVVTDEYYAVFPEFSSKPSRQLAREVPPIRQEDRVFIAVSVDFTGKTAGVVIRASYEGSNRGIYVIDEFEGTRLTIRGLQSALKDAFARAGCPKDVICLTNMSDEALLSVGDELPFPIVSVEKTNIRDDVAHLRSIIVLGRLFIASHLTRTFFDLDGALWNDSRTSFDISGHGGHFDLIRALCMLPSYVPHFLTEDGSLEKEHQKTVLALLALEDEDDEWTRHTGPLSGALSSLRFWKTR